MNTMTHTMYFFSGPKGDTSAEFSPTNKYIQTTQEGGAIRLWVNESAGVAGQFGTKLPDGSFVADPVSEFDDGFRYLGCKYDGKFFEGEWPNQEECEEAPDWAIALA